MGFVKMETMERAQRVRDAVREIQLDEQSLSVTIIQEMLLAFAKGPGAL
jgi:hypothetical protein